MKHKKLKIFIILIVLVLIVISIPLIQKKIMMERVKSKVLAVIYDLERQGNYHIIEKSIWYLKDADTTYTYITEIFAKDGVTVSRDIFENEEERSLFINGLSETCQLRETNEKIMGFINPHDIFEVESSFSPLGADSLFYGEIIDVEKVEKNGKKCYKISYNDGNKLEDGTYFEHGCFYVDVETYLPFVVDHYFEDTSERKTEYTSIEIGTVESIPIQYDIDYLKENSVEMYFDEITGEEVNVEVY